MSTQALYPWESARFVAEEDADLVAIQDAAREAWLADFAPDTGPIGCAVACVPDDCEEIRISVRVWSRSLAGAEMYTLTGWLHVGGGRVWHRLEAQADQIRFTQADVAKTGWVLARPKERRNTTEWIYYLARGTVDQHEYSLRSAPAGTGERRRQEAVFARF